MALEEGDNSLAIDQFPGQGKAQRTSYFNGQQTIPDMLGREARRKIQVKVRNQQNLAYRAWAFKRSRGQARGYGTTPTSYSRRQQYLPVRHSYRGGTHPKGQAARHLYERSIYKRRFN